MFKWILKLISSSEPATLSPYQEAILLYKGAKIKTPDVYRDFTAVYVLVRSIEQYLKTIGEAIDAIEDDRLFRSLEYKDGPTLVMAKRFFLSEDGNYLDVPEIHRAFMDAACVLLELYERKYCEKDLSPKEQANQLRILPVINNLIMLSVVFGEDQT